MLAATIGGALYSKPAVRVGARSQQGPKRGPQNAQKDPEKGKGLPFAAKCATVALTVATADLPCGPCRQTTEFVT